MRICTFKVDGFRDCPIYYRNFGRTFEYLTIVNGQLFTTHIDVKPSWITGTLYGFGIEKMPYSQQQLSNIIKQLRHMAEVTINTILDKK